MLMPTVIQLELNLRGALFVALFIGFFQALSFAAQPRFEKQDITPVDLFEASVALGDYNNDGWPDLFLAEYSNILGDGGDRIAFLHNDGQGRFALRSSALPSDLLKYDPKANYGDTFGTAAADYDRDGDLDLYLPLGTGRLHSRNLNILLRNDRGRFTDVTREAGLTEELASMTAIWLDYDRDGHLDLYVHHDGAVNDNPLSYTFIDEDPTAHNRLYRNNGDDTFTDVSVAAGLDVSWGTLEFNIVAPDINNDGWPDLYMGHNQGPDRLMLNDGQGCFRIAPTGDIGDQGKAEGVAVGDIDNDGDLDLFQPTAGNVGTFGEVPFRSLMLLNLGAGEFLDVTEGVGLGSLGGIPVHEAILDDLDNDGDVDLLTARPTFLFLNDGNGLFTDATPGSGLPPEGGLSLVAADYDRDGCLDLIYGTPLPLFDNSSGSIFRNACNGNHFLRVELVGVESNRDGIGARITVRTGALKQTREILGGVAHTSREFVAHFGLGGHTEIDTLEVRWPSGRVENYTDLPVDLQLRLFEGSDKHHVVVPTRWQHDMPDSAEIGETLQWEAWVQPSLFSPDARIGRATADLSAFGGPASLPLALDEDGTYHLPSGSAMVTGTHGQREVTVLIEQSSAYGPYWTQLVHLVEVPPSDPPTMSEDLFVGGLAPGWQLQAQIQLWDTLEPETEVFVDDSRVRTITPPGRSEFQTALAVQVDSLLPGGAGSQFEAWRVSFRAAKPVQHYKTLRFAFHPGTTQSLLLPVLPVFVNGRHLTGLAHPDPAWDWYSRTRLDERVREWHVVEIPLGVPGLEGPIESISIIGQSKGTFYFDDIQLLPERRPNSVTAVLEEHTSAIPASFALKQNYPNPFNSRTVIRFELPEAGDTEVALYNLVGQKVATLVKGVREPGSYTLRWDGRDDGGRLMASGVYFYRLQAGGRIATRKLLLLQ